MDIKNIPIKQDKNPVKDSTTQVSAEEFNSIVDTVKKSVVNKLGTTTRNDELYITHKLAGGTDVLETQIPKATTSTPGIMSKDDKSNLNKAVKSVSPRYGDPEKVYIDIEFVDKDAEVINIEQATQQAAGVMSAEDKAKLDSLSPAENYPLVSHTINGDSYNIATDEEESLTIFAPTEAGSEGYILASTGSGAPQWIPQADITAGNSDHARLADNATKASQDSMGRVISDTYLTKAELGDVGTTAQEAKNIAEQASRDVAAQESTIADIQETIENISAGGGATNAASVTYNSAGGSLTSTNVQNALTEVAGRLDGLDTANNEAVKDSEISEVRHIVNGVEYKTIVPSGETNNMDFVAPTEAGTQGHILQSSGDKNTPPTWADPTDFKVGSASSADNAAKLGGVEASKYVKKTDLTEATTSKAGLMSAADKNNLDKAVVNKLGTSSREGKLYITHKLAGGTDVLETEIPNATKDAPGLMSKDDKTKLDSLSSSGGLDGTTVVTQMINGKEYAVYAENADSEDVTIYAPTSKGSSNEVLLSSGEGEPYWASQSDLEGVSSAVRATFAERDNDGNVISTVYATKQYVNEAVGSSTGGSSSTKSYTFNASVSTSKGWYRVLTGFNNTTTGNNGVILNVAASYGNLSDAFTFLLNVGAGGNMSITQLSGIIHGKNHVPKIRVDYGTSGKWYADIYIPGGEEVVYNIWGIGQGAFQIPSYISSPNGSTYEFESVTGFKPDIKEDYSDYAFYIDINKPSSKGAAYVDVGGNMEMRKLWEAARKPVLMDSEGNYVELRKDNWRVTIEGINIIESNGLNLDSSCAHCDIMEIIPEYYYKVQNYKYGESDMYRCWFSLSPIPGGRKIAQQVVGKFKAHIKDNDGVEEMRSIPNVVPSSDKTIREFWLCARNKSENHGLADINFRNYLMFHIMSKYKTRNVQSLTNKSNPDYVGTSSNMSWKGMDGSSITLTETQISQGITEFDLQKTVPTGLSYSVESDGAYFADVSTKSHGVSIGGFENPYGQYWEFVQGIATNAYYVLHWEGNLVPSSPSSSLSSYSFARAIPSDVMPASTGGAYENKVHISSANQQIYMFPEEIYSISSGLLSYRDVYYYDEIGEVICYGGKSADNSDGLREFKVGPMAIASSKEWNFKHESISSRLAYYGNVRPVSYSELTKRKSGKTENRPTGLTKADSGLQYFDTTLGKSIWWNGSAWVDALGLYAVNEYAEVRHVVNGTEVKVISTDTESQGLNIYAPTEVGSDGYIVAQQGNTAAFVDPADIGLK